MKILVEINLQEVIDLLDAVRDEKYRKLNELSKDEDAVVTLLRFSKKPEGEYLTIETAIKELYEHEKDKIRDKYEPLLSKLSKAESKLMGA